MSDKSEKKEPDLKEQIIDEIQPKLQESFSELKKQLIVDLRTDIKELISKTHIPDPAPADPKSKMPSTDEIKGILGKVLGKDAEKLDVAQLMQLVPKMQPQSAAPPAGVDSAAYIKMEKEKNQNQMIMTVLPLLLGQQNNPMNAMFLEMMQRTMVDSMMDAATQRKMLNSVLMKRLGGEITLADYGAVAPIKSAADQMARTPMGSVAQTQQPQ